MSKKRRKDIKKWSEEHEIFGKTKWFCVAKVEKKPRKSMQGMKLNYAEPLEISEGIQSY